MLKVSATDFQRDIGRYQDIAQREPVAVIRDGREPTILISTEEYARLKRRDRQVLALSDFTDADIEALERSRPDPRAATFDAENPH
ncbi:MULTISPECIES: type II toxin-antitoxin system Phd/YefM family antitoxin [Nitrospirillum]|uniref:Antitoxin Phd_YefM of type II toxin-antitoxin system n=1 Tax=Nitrospirillum amazonense TaxID=28077 RepID=A0A560G5L2_9PROT|nr:MULTISPECIES: type II toxin-antitoxin system Phd/YefM family antitoxin [Nitrospirillum]MEA1676463.1 type II toxin-antitoxin system Phd/YefM family antitoxin [Nitrospirillum sp. BR 11163]MEC4592651.1 type II toxin-antitoxin system Phd/YefM family antitoxin [Nitrospirillum amazonense]TWB29111.1 antitoxin Phd_YefM of type II toxin-antitoxin system [Nitrospirillum amazonense]